MDKKSIIGIVLIGILFFGFTIYSSRQQQKYQEELAAYQAAHSELTQPVVPDSSAVAAAPVVESLGAATPIRLVWHAKWPCWVISSPRPRTLRRRRSS